MQTNEWVSVSTMAKRLGVSKQTVYNRIKKGGYDTQTFERGTKMIGILIKQKENGEGNTEKEL